MATKCLTSSGNATTAATWATGDATSLNDTIANNTAVTTTASANRSSGATTGAITIDGIYVRIASRAASPTGTLTIELWNNTDSTIVAGTTVTINVSDVHVGSSTANGGCGWYLFKFASPVTLLAAKSYMVQASTSSSSQINLYCTSGTNWARILRTTTTGALGASDIIIICGEMTGAGTGNNLTVTWENTATTNFGYVQVGKRGIFTVANTAFTTYELRCQNFIVSGGTVNMGTQASRLAATCIFQLMLLSTSAGQYGFRVLGGSTVNGGGASKTAITRMTADKAAAATVIALVSTSGWAASDVLAFPPTGSAINEAEQKSVNTVDSGTQVTLSAGLTNAHSGTNNANGDTRAEVGNLTRNVIIVGNSSTNVGYTFWDSTSVSALYDVQFKWVGISSNGSNGVDVNVTGSGSLTMDSCSVHEPSSASGGRCFLLNSVSGTVVLNNCVAYSGVNSICLNFNGVTSGTITVSGCLFINIGTGTGISMTSGVGNFTLTNSIFTGFTTGLSYVLTANPNLPTGTSVICHNCTTGFTLSFTGSQTSATGTWNFTAWRNATGVSLTLARGGYYHNLFLNLTCFGNTTAGLNISNINCPIRITGSFDGGATVTQPIGVLFSATTSPAMGAMFHGVTFGATNQHSTCDISVAIGGSVAAWFTGCTFASANLVDSADGLAATPYNPFMYLGVYIDPASGSGYQILTGLGTLSRDATIQDSSIDTVRLKPRFAAAPKFACRPFEFRVDAQAYTASAKVRKSSTGAGDAATYNGNFPRLVLLRDDSMGITADTVIATATAASAGAFEVISGSTPTFTKKGIVRMVIDCDGTAGWMNLATTPTLT